MGSKLQVIHYTEIAEKIRSKMWKLMLVLLSTVTVVTRCAIQKGDMNPLSRLMMDLRTQVEKLTSKVDGINSNVGNLATKVDGINSHLGQLESKVETKVASINSRFQLLSRDVESVKNGFTGDPFSSCTGDVTTVTGTTIKYPLTGTYTTFENCLWTVKAGNNVKVSFTKFDLEVNNDDYVELTQNGQRKGLWCGHSIPSDELVLNGEFTAKFHSDQSNQYTGFQMEIRK